MRAETQKKARAATFLTRSALCLMLLPVAFLVWALQAYPPQEAIWVCFSLAIYIWPFAGVLFIVSAGLRVRTPEPRLEPDAGFREAHGH